MDSVTNISNPRVFRDENLQNEFDKNGFVKFKMFSAEQIGRLRNFYLETQAQHETVTDKKKFHATNDTDNAELIASADAFIKAVMFEEIDKHFCNYTTIGASYLIKQPVEASELGPHQDLRFVDEEKFYSFNIWVATEPTNKTNGCLRFLKGSHRIHDTVRPLPMYPWRYESVASIIPTYFTDVPTEIGECIILNHACIHASYPNLSGHTRIAAIVAMMPEGADIIHYFLPEGDPKNKVEKYLMTMNDFIHLKGGQRPEHAQLIDTFAYDFSSIEVKAFQTWIDHNCPVEKTPSINNSSSFELIKNKLSALFKIYIVRQKQ
jgi:hypothetical protein